MVDSNQKTPFLHWDSLSSSDDEDGDFSPDIATVSSISEGINDAARLIDWINHYDANHQNNPGSSSSQGTVSTLKNRFRQGIDFIERLQSQFTRKSRLVKEKDKQIFELRTDNDNLRRQLVGQEKELKKLRKRNAKFEEERRQRQEEPVPLGRLRSKSDQLLDFFWMLVSKLEQGQENSTAPVMTKENVFNLKQEISSLLHRVQGNLKKWEKNQLELDREMNMTRAVLETIYEKALVREKVQSENSSNAFMHSIPIMSNQTLLEIARQNFQTPSLPSQSENTLSVPPIKKYKATPPALLSMLPDLEMNSSSGSISSNNHGDTFPFMSAFYQEYMSTQTKTPKKTTTGQSPSPVQNQQSGMSSSLKSLRSSHPISTSLPGIGCGTLYFPPPPLNATSTPSTTHHPSVKKESKDAEAPARSSPEKPPQILLASSSGPFVTASSSSARRKPKHSLPAMTFLSSKAPLPVPEEYQTEALEVLGVPDVLSPPKPPREEPNVCRLCKMSFKTLVQMKLHQTVVHSRSTKP